jgi:hypothetical protein
MIIETIITTMDRDGKVNIAPMGVEWGDDAIVIKPYFETTTFQNIRETGAAVVNLTDDVYLFAEAAISDPQYPTTPAVAIRGVVLEAACSWRELAVETLDASLPRCRITTRIAHHGRRREFLGFNRARHAVLEAAILCTRLHLIPKAEIESEIGRLQIIVDKTAGPREFQAMTLLTSYLRSWSAPPAQPPAPPHSASSS